MRFVVHVVCSGCLWCEMLTHYLSCSSRPRADPKKCVIGHVVSNLCFLYSVWSTDHVLCLGVSRERNVDTLFFILGWACCVSEKASRDTLRQTCLFASSTVYGLHSVFGCVRGMKHRHNNFYALMGPVRILEKTQRDTLRWTCIFASGTIRGSCSWFCHVQDMKCRCIIFYARVGLMQKQ
jgi:hypothetical protein